MNAGQYITIREGTAR